MRIRRTFSKDFKRQIVEEILSGGTTTAAACRKYSIAYPVVKQWQKAYALGKLNNEPTTEEGHKEKIAQLERKVGQLTMEIDVLKKALKRTHSQQKKNAPLLTIPFPSSKVKEGGAE
jgi:transposase-like protein